MFKDVKELKSLLRTECILDRDSDKTFLKDFIITKSHKVKQVKINYIRHDESNEIIITFEKLPDIISEQRFNAFMQLIKAEINGIGIYRAKDLKLIVGNNKYFNILSDLYGNHEKYLGLKYSDFAVDYNNGDEYEIIKKLIEKHEIYSETDKCYRGAKNKDIYLDITYIPMVQENEVDYIVNIVNDVTERINIKKQFESNSMCINNQKRDLEKLLKMQEEFFSIWHTSLKPSDNYLFSYTASGLSL